MPITAGIDVGTGCVKAVLFEVEGGETRWLGRSVDRIRQRDPGVRIWVSMSHFHGGADRLLTARRSLLVEAIRVFLDKHRGCPA